MSKVLIFEVIIRRATLSSHKEPTDVAFKDNRSKMNEYIFIENNFLLILTHSYLVMARVIFWLSQMVGRVPLASPEWEKAEVQLSQNNIHNSLPQSRVAGSKCQ